MIMIVWIESGDRWGCVCICPLTPALTLYNIYPHPRLCSWLIVGGRPRTPGSAPLPLVLYASHHGVDQLALSTPYSHELYSAMRPNITLHRLCTQALP